MERQIRWLHGTALLGLLVFSPVVFAGQCTYEQLSPIIKRTYPACQPASTKEECDLLPHRFVKRVEFQEGECSKKGVVAVCEVDGVPIYFYSGDYSDHARGCEARGGLWRPELMPKGAGSG